MHFLHFEALQESAIHFTIKAALADRKKVVKTGSISMGRGRYMGILRESEKKPNFCISVLITFLKDNHKNF